MVFIAQFGFAASLETALILAHKKLEYLDENDVV
jgi:hypothetical protein